MFCPKFSSKHLHKEDKPKGTETSDIHRNSSIDLTLEEAGSQEDPQSRRIQSICLAQVSLSYGNKSRNRRERHKHAASRERESERFVCGDGRQDQGLLWHKIKDEGRRLSGSFCARHAKKSLEFGDDSNYSHVTSLVG